ncbi:MAG TPA: DMT family transporter [Rhodobacterales bacterium]|nr:DMT family transporter [Rhodobacterales bacterium]
MSDHLKGLLITLLGVVLIVPDSLFVRLIDAPALTIAFWRSALAGAALGLGVLVVQGPQAYRGLARFGPGLWLYIAATAIPGVLFVLAIKLTSVANVAFIIAATPAFAALQSWAFLSERPSRRMLWTMLAVAIGIGVIAFGSGQTDGASRIGDLAAIAIAFIFAASLTTARKLRAASLVPAVPIAQALAALVLLPFVSPFAVAPESWPLIALHGGVFVAISTALLATGPRYLPSSEVALLILLESVFAPILAWAVIGESASVWALIGGGIVLGALAASNAIALSRRSRSGAKP